MQLFVLEKINREEALRYLGYRGNEPDKKTLDIIDECEAELLRAASPKYLYKRFDRLEFENDCVAVSDIGLRLCGESVSNHIKGCGGVVLMCATLSAGADRLIRQYQAADMTKAVITDALASAAIEQVCNAVDEEINELYPQEYKTWRFSPGYGDLTLDIQGDLLRVLDAQRKIGLTLAQSGMLIPTKSVTAIIGISKTELSRQRTGCAGCSMRHNCKFRKTGERCV